MNHKIQFDLHTHSIASGHGTTDTISMMAQSASEKGLTALGVSDHGPSTIGSATLSYFQNLSLAPKERFGVHLFYGVEANICNKHGDIDVPTSILELLDYGIVSMHTANLMPSNQHEHTDAYLSAIQHPCIKIIGHCDDTRFLADFELLLQGAIASNTWFELNNASLHPNQYRGDTLSTNETLLKLHMKYDYPLLLSSDSHGAEHVGNFSYILPLLQDLSFPQDLILNHTLNPITLMSIFSKI